MNPETLRNRIYFCSSVNLALNDRIKRILHGNFSILTKHSNTWGIVPLQRLVTCPRDFNLRNILVHKVTHQPNPLGDFKGCYPHTGVGLNAEKHFACVAGTDWLVFDNVFPAGGSADTRS